MKTVKPIIIILIAVISFSTSQAVAGWFGGDKLFPDHAVKAGIKEYVFEATEDSRRQDWGKVTDVVDIEILKKYRTNQKNLAKLKQEYYERGIKIMWPLDNICTTINIGGLNDKFSEEILAVVFLANFIVEGQKHKIGGLLLFTKYPKDNEVTLLEFFGATWTVKDARGVHVKNWSRKITEFKDSIKYYRDVIEYGK